MLKFVNPLKWALAQSLVNMSSTATPHHQSDQIEKTRITLLHVCGIDPTKVPIAEVEELKTECARLRKLQMEYQRMIKESEKLLSDLAGKEIAAKQLDVVDIDK